MVEVRFRVFKNGDFRFSCKGHAGAGVKGTDLVCCAASSYAYGLLENIQLAADEMESFNPRVEEENGIMKISFKPKKKYINSMYLIFTAFRNAYKALERGHEEYIKVY